MSEWLDKHLRLSMICRVVILCDHIDKVIDDIEKVERELHAEGISGKHNLEAAIQLLVLARRSVSQKYRETMANLIGEPKGLDR